MKLLMIGITLLMCGCASNDGYVPLSTYQPSQYCPPAFTTRNGNTAYTTYGNGQSAFTTFNGNSGFTTFSQ